MDGHVCRDGLCINIYMDDLNEEQQLEMSDCWIEVAGYSLMGECETCRANGSPQGHIVSRFSAQKRKGPASRVL